MAEGMAVNESSLGVGVDVSEIKTIFFSNFSSEKYLQSLNFRIFNPILFNSSTWVVEFK